MELKVGDVVKFNKKWYNQHTVKQGKKFTIRKIKVLPKGTTNLDSLILINMCRKKDVTVVYFESHPQYLAPVPPAFLSKVN